MLGSVCVGECSESLMKVSGYKFWGLRYSQKASRSRKLSTNSLWVQFLGLTGTPWWTDTISGGLGQCAEIVLPLKQISTNVEAKNNSKVLSLGSEATQVLMDFHQSISKAAFLLGGSRGVVDLDFSTL